jgi:hypothetical protein
MMSARPQTPVNDTPQTPVNDTPQTPVNDTRLRRAGAIPAQEVLR